MIAIEPSEDRIERAAIALFNEYQIFSWKDAHPNICAKFKRDARVALLADAPALVEARIDSLDTVIDKLDVETETARWLLPSEGAGAVVLTLNDIKRSVELEIERLQADLDKERGKTI